MPNLVVEKVVNTPINFLQGCEEGRKKWLG